MGAKWAQWEAYNGKQFIPAALLALLYSGVISWFRDYQLGGVRFLASVCVVFVLAVYAPRVWAAERGRCWPFAVWGCSNAFFIVAMRTSLTPTGGGDWGVWLLAPFVLFAGTYTVCAAGLYALARKAELRGSQLLPRRRTWLLYFVVLMVAWLPVFLVYGPVRISPDSNAVLRQAVLNGPLSDDHPIMYTLLLAAVLRPAAALGSVTAGAYVFGFAQLSMFAAVLSYSIYWIRRRGCPRVLAALALGLFAFCPLFPINGITLWKDIPFNSLLLVLTIRMYEIGESRGAVLQRKPYLIGFLLLLVGLCFMRGNGKWIVLLCGLALLLVFRKEWKRWLALFVPVLVVVLVVQGPVYRSFGITRRGAMEAAALPLQQVARYANEGGSFTPEQTEVLERFISIDDLRQNYWNISVDAIKGSPSFNRFAFSANLGDFLRVWLQIAFQNPETAVNAWANTTYGFWKYDFPATTCVLYDDYNSAAGIRYMDFVYGLTGLNLRQFIADRSGFLPIGLLAAITTLSAACMLVRRQGRKALALLVPIGVWLSMVITTPTYCDFRYTLVLAMGLPLTLFLPLAPDAPDALAAETASGTATSIETITTPQE